MDTWLPRPFPPRPGVRAGRRRRHRAGVLVLPRAGRGRAPEETCVCGPLQGAQRGRREGNWSKPGWWCRPHRPRGPGGQQGGGWEPLEHHRSLAVWTARGDQGGGRGGRAGVLGCELGRGGPGVRQGPLEGAHGETLGLAGRKAGEGSRQPQQLESVTFHREPTDTGHGSGRGRRTLSGPDSVSSLQPSPPTALAVHGEMTRGCQRQSR